MAKFGCCRSQNGVAGVFHDRTSLLAGLQHPRHHPMLGSDTDYIFEQDFNDPDGPLRPFWAIVALGRAVRGRKLNLLILRMKTPPAEDGAMVADTTKQHVVVLYRSSMKGHRLDDNGHDGTSTVRVQRQNNRAAIEGSLTTD